MADTDRADVRRTERPPASSTGAVPRDARAYLDLSDVALLDLVREGESSAFAALWVRHADQARRVAGRISSTVEPDDLLAEAYTRILAAVRSGTGPEDAFLPYLYATMRNVSQNAGRRAAETIPPGAADGPDLTAPTDDDVLDRTIVREAFASLPPQWRTVLWLTEVQGMQPRDVAAATGTSPNAVAAQAHRAREALKAAWLAAHVRGPYPTDRCAWAIGLLARDRLLRPRVRRHLDEHLDACDHCTLVAAELASLRSRLHSLLVPLLALPAAATGAPAPLPWTGGPTTAGPVDPSASGGMGAGGGLAAGAGVAPGVSSAASVLVSAGAAAVSAVAMSAVVVGMLAPEPASPVVVAEAPARTATPAPALHLEPTGPSAPPAASRQGPAAPPSDTADDDAGAAPGALPGPADVPAPDVPEPDVPKPDVPKPDVPKPDVPKPDVPEVDVPEVDVPEVDVPDASPSKLPVPPVTPDRPGPPADLPEADDAAGPFGVESFDPGGRLLPEVSGTAPAGAVVELLAGGVVVATVTAGGDGTWHAELDLPPDTHVLAVRPAASPGDLVRLGEVTLLAPAPLDVRD